MSDETFRLFGWPNALRMPLACVYAQCSRWTLARAVREGELPAVRNGKTLVFKRDDLDRWMLTPQPSETSRGPVVARRPTAGSATEEALKRLAEINKRAKR